MRHAHRFQVSKGSRMMTPAVVFVLLAVLGQTSGNAGANIARGGKVTQSSVAWNGVPERAIDGKRDNIYSQSSCSHTNHDQNPWWRLDLLKTYKINSVTVTNRKDCCHDRIKGAEIRIGNSPDGNDGSRCAVIASLGPGATKKFECKGLVGRYVTIVIPGRKEYLTLCEVEVTGIESDESDDSNEYACG
ncbi:fucolectin-like [Centropristis striata]|uniref:fucolectin-like n=1 Tax=Centropristis striata TaxID=184440 RepID=UPI0027E0DEC8|nr:fucolectin-like [Centropristis striata]